MNYDKIYIYIYALSRDLSKATYNSGYTIFFLYVYFWINYPFEVSMTAKSAHF